MAIIVLHQETGRKYVLLGMGYGEYHPSRPGMFLGQTPAPEEGTGLEMAAVCDSSGNIAWVPSKEIIVVDVDGTPPGEVLLVPKTPGES